MPDVARSERPRAARPRLGLGETWRRLNVEQRAAAVGAVLLIVSTLGPFTFVEAAIVLVGASVLLLLRRRAEGRKFHIPFGDGAVIAAAGTWAGLLILIRMFSRPLGQGLLALVCAAILIVAGLSERAKRPRDDLPEEVDDDGAFAGLAPRSEPRGEPRTEAAPDRAAYRDETLPLRDDPPAAGQPPRRAPRAAQEETAPLGDPATGQLPLEPPPAKERLKPAKVLPPPPRDEDLEEPPSWDDPPR